MERLLLDLLPDADHVTRQTRWIAAPPQVVWDALHEVYLTDLPLTLALSAVRFLPARLTRRGRSRAYERPLVDVLPIPRLASTPQRSVVFGGALQAWRLTGGRRPPELDAEGLRAWSERGWVKVAMDLRLEAREGGTQLSAETRVRATDDETRRRFARYWLVVRPGSSAIRWELLRAVARKARSGP
jgi:hypothetical protein